MGNRKVYDVYDNRTMMVTIVMMKRTSLLLLKGKVDGGLRWGVRGVAQTRLLSDVWYLSSSSVIDRSACMVL